MSCPSWTSSIFHLASDLALVLNRVGLGAVQFRGSTMMLRRIDWVPFRLSFDHHIPLRHKISKSKACEAPAELICSSCRAAFLTCLAKASGRPPCDNLTKHAHANNTRAPRNCLLPVAPFRSVRHRRRALLIIVRFVPIHSGPDSRDARRPFAVTAPPLESNEYNVLGRRQ